MDTADTVTIHNDTVRTYHLPTRSGPGGDFGARVKLQGGERLEVPRWYLHELLKERGWRRRLGIGADASERDVRGRDTFAVVEVHGGAQGAFAARVKAKRKARREKELAEQAAQATAHAGKLEDRLARLEAEQKDRARAEKELSARARAAEAEAADAKKRIAELEAQLGGADGGKPTGDDKSDSKKSSSTKK